MLNKLTKIKRLLLIGKEIWHNKRSMRGRFIIYLLSLVLLAGSAMLILLNVIGIVQPPSHDIDRFLEYELNTRTNDIKRQMNALAAHNIDLSQQLQNDIDRVMLEQGIYNNYDALNNNPEALTAIQQATYQTLAAKMQQAPASGALYLINASVNTNMLEPTYNGLFLKFTNIYSENTLFNETCMFRGNPQVARNNNISLYSTWQLELNVHAYPQAEKLRQLQSENNQVQKQYGLAAMRLQEAQEKQKQTANQYIHLEEQLAALQNEIQQVRLQMEQTQQEKLQAQQEREQAQQQFNFAQAALEKAIEKKLESVDPDSYQMFIDNLATLTPKEEDIFNLYVQGCSTKDIISQLGITENTLKYHNKNIYSKLGVKTRKELLQYIELMRNAEH